MMRAAKLYASILALSFSGMVLGVHITEHFFPWVHGFGLIFISTILLGIFNNQLTTVQSLTFTVIAAIGLRLFVFLWPASMIGMDPDRYALGVNGIIQTGDVSFVAKSSIVYSILSMFHLLNSSVSIISGLTGKNVLMAFPILIGLMLPLSGMIIVKRVNQGFNHRISGSVASLVGGFIAIGVFFSYWPIVQLIAVLLWSAGLLFSIYYFETKEFRALLGLLIILFAMLFSHKISLLVPMAIFLITLTLHLANLVFSGGLNLNMVTKRAEFSMVFVLLLITAVGLIIQWTFLTVLLRSVILDKLLPLTSGGVSVRPSSIPVLTATPGNPGIPGILIRRSDYLVLVPIISISGFYLWLRDRNLLKTLTISSAAIPVILVVITVIGAPVMPARRAILFGIPSFAAVVGLVSSEIWSGTGRRSRALVIFIVLLVLLPQVGSSTLAPDYPGEPRMYLTEGEAEAKSFMLDHSNNNVAMDFFYAHESTRLNFNDPSYTSEVEYVNDGLLNGTLLNQSQDSILLREHTDVMRFDRGRYRLTWDPVKSTDESIRYHRIFDNANSIGYRKLS